MSTRLETGGTFLILVSDFLGNKTAGYSLSLQRPNNPAGIKALDFGQAVTGSIDSPSEMDGYSFQAKAGDMVHMRVSAEPGIDPRIELFDPQGNRLESNARTYSRYAVVSTRLETGGAFLILVSDFLGNKTAGYSLSLRRPNNPVGIKALSFGQTVTGSIDSPSEMDAYSFQAKAGVMVRLRVRTEPGLDPRIELFDLQGNRLGSNTRTYSRDAVLNIRLETGGTFLILVSDFLGNKTAGYSLTLEHR